MFEIKKEMRFFKIHTRMFNINEINQILETIEDEILQNNLKNETIIREEEDNIDIQKNQDKRPRLPQKIKRSSRSKSRSNNQNQTKKRYSDNREDEEVKSKIKRNSFKRNSRDSKTKKKQKKRSSSINSFTNQKAFASLDKSNKESFSNN
jgi:hypothetical protein